MKVFKRNICLALACVLLVSVLFAGCTGTPTTTTAATTKQETTAAPTTEATTTEETIDISEEVTLKMYQIGEKLTDYDLVYTEINKITKEKINATVETLMLGWAEWDQKYPLLFASGEEFDMIFTANWAKYSETAAKGGWWELSQERLEKYAPDLLEQIPADGWKAVKIDGKAYMTPDGSPYFLAGGCAIRGDLRKKYGMDPLTSIDDLVEYWAAVKANETDIIPFADANPTLCGVLTTAFYFMDLGLGSVGLGGAGAYFDYNDMSGTLIDPKIYKDKYDEYLVKMVEFRQAGYWPQSSLTSVQGTYDEQFKAGRGASTFVVIDGANSLYQYAKANYPTWEVEYVDLTGGKKIGTQGFLGAGMAINAKSKNPERALMMLNLLIGDETVNRMTQYGLENKHYTLNSEGKKAITDDTTLFGGYSNWGFRNIKWFLFSTGNFPGYEELYIKFSQEQQVFHPLCSFIGDTTNVKTEIALISAIDAETNAILTMGFSDTGDEAIALARSVEERMKEADPDNKCYEELVKQVKAFMEAYNNN